MCVCMYDKNAASVDKFTLSADDLVAMSFLFSIKYIELELIDEWEISNLPSLVISSGIYMKNYRLKICQLLKNQKTVKLLKLQFLKLLTVSLNFKLKPLNS